MLRSVGFTIAETSIALTVVAFFVSGTLEGRQILEVSRLHSQIAQLAEFDEATEQFYARFGGLPGDLLAARAEREGLPYGDGTPGHSDGDGKISPCNPGWQWNLGCETALFWSDLAISGLISGDFNAGEALTDGRLKTIGAMMTPYLPESPFGGGIYITVWNTDKTQESPGSPLLYGNYYEISRILGVEDGKMKDDSAALTPLEARKLDQKMDDGYPLTGRVVVNGNAHWPQDAWGSFATPGPQSCVAPNRRYNTRDYFFANRPLCHLAVAFTCCKKDAAE